MYNLIDRPMKIFDVLEKSNAPSLNYVVPVFYGLKRLFSVAPQDPQDESYLKLFKEKFNSRLNQKFILKDIHFTSTLLDPNYKKFTFIADRTERAMKLQVTISHILLMSPKLSDEEPRISEVFQK